MFRDGVGIYCHLSPRFSSCYINDMLILACVPVVYKNITSYFINIQYNLKLEFSYYETYTLVGFYFLFQFCPLFSFKVHFRELCLIYG